MQEIPKKDICNIRVSSVLNRDVKSYGKQNLFDGCSDSCWNSDKNPWNKALKPFKTVLFFKYASDHDKQGSPQWVVLEFSEPFKISGFDIEFQGGFVGQDCTVELSPDGNSVNESFYPEDVNGIQNFTLSKPQSSKNLKFVFNGSTDFFGRIN